MIYVLQVKVIVMCCNAYFEWLWIAWLCWCDVIDARPWPKNDLCSNTFLRKNRVCKGYVMLCFAFEKCLSICLARGASLLDQLFYNRIRVWVWWASLPRLVYRTCGSGAILQVGRSSGLKMWPHFQFMYSSYGVYGTYLKCLLPCIVNRIRVSV